MSNFLDSSLDAQAREDFSRVRSKELFSRLIHMLKKQTHSLLSFNEVKSLLRPRAERYKGMQSVPIEKIVGSEGRYRDFNRAFLPKHDYLRNRWMSVDKAHLKDVILPPIKLYQIGSVYFVRDGNHRVSVAKTKGVMAIDAEVVEVTSEFPLEEALSMEEMIHNLIAYERQRFMDQTHLEKVIPMEFLEFSAPGRYDEILNHILVHKYYINQNKPKEISFQEAAKSWYSTIFLPIIEIISKEGIMARFPGRTKADLYTWAVKHWDQLKAKYGEKVSMKDAVSDFSQRFGKSIWQQLMGLFRRKKKRGPYDPGSQM